MINITSIVGARPQFIKAAPLSRALQSHPGIKEHLLHTGQHYDEKMSRVFFKELGMAEPALNLEIGSGSHGEQTAKMLIGIEKYLLDNRPDGVILYGDTNSTLAGALAATKLNIPTAHVEAGLRSFNREMPEEINRVLTDHAADLLFAPTQNAVDNLAREGLDGAKIHLVGDIMLDAVEYVSSVVNQKSRILTELNLKEREYILATVHRAENTDSASNLEAILGALLTISETIPVIFPVHPRTRAAINALFGSLTTSNSDFYQIEPVSYLEMIKLQKYALLIVTDSGGVQKEAFFHGVPCATLRRETEWIELVELGWNRVIPPTSKKVIVSEIRKILAADRPATPKKNPFGNGSAANQMASILASKLAS